MPEARPRNRTQSLAANQSAVARAVPPLRLSGSAADKGRTAAASIAVSSEANEAAPKPKVSLASSSKSTHHSKARQQHSASQSGAKIPASRTAAANAARCADMWRTSAAVAPSQSSKSTPGPQVNAPLAPLPEAGASLVDFKWAWKRDSNPAATAAAASAAGTGRVDAAARLARTQQPIGGAFRSGWGQLRKLRDSSTTKPLSQLLQEQWDQCATTDLHGGANPSPDPYRPSEAEDGGGVRRWRQQC